MATQTGRERERARTQNMGLKEMVLESMDIIGVAPALLMETAMAADLRDPKGRDLPLEKLAQEDLNSTEVVQEVICEREGSIQEALAPAAGRHFRQERETRTTENGAGATMRQEGVRIGRRHCSLLLEDSHKTGADHNFSSCDVDGLVV